MLSTNTAVTSKQALRDQLARDVERYQADGGTVTFCTSLWNAGCQDDLETIQRRRFDLRVARDTFGKDSKSRLIVDRSHLPKQTD